LAQSDVQRQRQKRSQPLPAYAHAGDNEDPPDRIPAHGHDRRRQGDDRKQER